MSKSVPSETLFDAECSSPRQDQFSQNRLAPERLATAIALACKNPIVRFAECCSCCHSISVWIMIEWTGTGFCEASALQGPTTPHTIERVTWINPSEKLMSRHFKPNNSLLAQSCRRGQHD